MATFEDFQRIDMRVGTITSAAPLSGAHKPAITLEIDFGDEIGVRNSSAQITLHYAAEQLAGRQVVAVVNFPPRRIAGFVSEVLVLGAMPEPHEVVLLAPDHSVPNGTRIG